MEDELTEKDESFSEKSNHKLSSAPDLLANFQTTNYLSDFQINDYDDYVKNLTDEQQNSVDKILDVYAYGTDRQAKIIFAISTAMSDFSEQSRINIAISVAQKNGRRVAEYFDLFNIQDEDAKVNIAIVCAFTHPRRLSKHIKLFKIKEEKSRFKIAYCAALNSGGDVLQYFDNYNLLHIDFKREILARSLLTTPHSINFINDIVGNSQIKAIEHTSSIDDIKKWLIEISKYDNTIVPPSSHTVYDDMKRKDAGVKLLSGYILGNGQIQEPKQSLKLLTAFPSGSLGELEITPNSFGDFFEIILELQSKYIIPFFSNIHLDKALFESSDNFKTVIGFINACNLLSQTRGSRAYCQYNSLINSISQSLGIKTLSGILQIDINNIQDVTHFVQKNFMGELMTKIKSITTERFDDDDLFKISDMRGGDIQVIITLIARYSGKKEWSDAIPVLIKIIRETLNGSFERYKYFGNENDGKDKELVSKQIGFLTDNHIQKRIENSSRIDIISQEPELHITHKELIESMNAVFQNVLLNDATYEKKDIGDILNLNDKELSKKLKNTYNNKDHMLLHCLDEILEKDIGCFDMESTKKIIGKIKSLKDLLLTNMETKKEINGLSDKLRIKTPKVEVLFTTFFDDPKLMLSISNLMRVASCFNYNNGVEIQALMSYVIDSNIKGLAGFVINASDFSSFSEFQTFCNMIKLDGDELNLMFKQSNRELVVENNNKKFIIKLDNLLYKRFVKIGKTKNGENGMRLEAPSVQHHKMIHFIEDKAMDLYKEKACSVGAHQNQSIIIPPSRSILGSYSDVSAGRKKGEYLIE